MKRLPSSTSLLRGSAFLSVASFAGLTMCASPTAVEVRVYPSKVCRDPIYGNASIQVLAGEVGGLDVPFGGVNASDRRLCENLESLPKDVSGEPYHLAIVQPSDGKTDEFGFRVLVAPQGNIEACSFETRYDGCLVSRRLFRFSKGDTRIIRIDLHPECIGRDRECAADGYGTCGAEGKCVGAKIDESKPCDAATGCDEGALTSSPQRTDASVVDSDTPDARIDSSVDAGPDGETFVPIAGAKNFGSIAAGQFMTCAVHPARTPGGKVYCWGRLDSGFTGNVGISTVTSTTTYPLLNKANLRGIQVAITGNNNEEPYEHPCVLERTSAGEVVDCGTNAVAGPPLKSLELALSAHAGTISSYDEIAFGSLRAAGTNFGTPGAVRLATVLGAAGGKIKKSYATATSTSSSVILPNTTLLPNVSATLTLVRGAYGRTCFVAKGAPDRLICQNEGVPTDDTYFPILDSDGSYRELGNGVLGATDMVTEIGIGPGRTCAAIRPATSGAGSTGHRVVCFGQATGGSASTDDGALGVLDRGRDFIGTVALANVRAIRVGSSFGCALLDNGSVWCWGDRHTGQSGEPVEQIGSPIPRKVPGFGGEPTDVNGRAVEITSGLAHTCVRTDRDEVYCWGDNGYRFAIAQAPDGIVSTPVKINFP